MDIALVRRVERAWTRADVEHAEALARIDPSWGTSVFPVGDGWAVLCGPGLYVNRVLGAGLDGPVDPAAIDDFERRARAARLPPAFTVTDVTERTLLADLARRGYIETSSATAAVRAAGRRAPAGPADVTVEQVPVERIGEWQEVSALGWGRATADERRASDAFSDAGVAVGHLYFVARDAADGRPLGCAVAYVTDGMLTLGGMSTLPAERRRGVQAALVARRLEVAGELGCDLAVAAAVTGGDSLRNLERLGFTVVHERRALTLG
jgi:GNAT superfamily N-acetyltransferase